MLILQENMFRTKQFSFSHEIVVALNSSLSRVFSSSSSLASRLASSVAESSRSASSSLMLFTT